MNIRIRKASESDYKELQKLIEGITDLHINKYPMIYSKPKSKINNKESIKTIINDKLIFLCLAEVDGRIVGYIQASVRKVTKEPILVPREYIKLDSIFIQKPFRKIGIGKKLLQGLFSWSKKQRISSIELNVYDKSKEAIKMYEKYGFKIERYHMRKEIKRPTRASS